MLSKNRVWVAVIGGLLAFGTLAHAEDVILDGFSSSPVYDHFSFNRADIPDPPPSSNPDDLSFEEITFPSTGGSPGDHMRVAHNHDVDRDGSGEPFGGDGLTSLQSAMINSGIAYNPSVSGAFTTVTYSLDYMVESGVFNSLYFAMGDVGGGGSFRGFTTVNNDGSWHNLSLTFDQSDFSSRDFAGSTPLEFGFGFTSSADVFNGSETYVVKADNFRVTVSSVPEPSGLLIAIGTVFGLLAQRKR